MAFYFQKRCKFLNSFVLEIIFKDKSLIVKLNRLSYHCYFCLLPFYCNIRQLVGLFSFLIRKRQSSKDYSTSYRIKLDMGLIFGLDLQPLFHEFLMSLLSSQLYKGPEKHQILS